MPPSTETVTPASAVKLRYPVNVLASFHYYSKINMGLLAGGGLRCIADSGAYSADSQGSVIHPDEFAAWAVRWKTKLAWVASLDVIGNPDGTYRNWQYLRGAYDIDFVPTVHYGDDGSSLRRYVDEGVDYIGLGGMVPFKSEPKRLLRWSLAMFRYARKNFPQVRFHGWGVTHPDLIMNLPWYSVDSSGWGAAYRYGRLSLFDRRTGKFAGVKCDGRDAYRHRALITQYGVTPADVARSVPANRPLLCRVSAAAYQHLEDHLRKRHPVSAPSYGLNATVGLPGGPNVHLASSNGDSHRRLISAPSASTAHLVGPHIHLAEGAAGNLLNLSTPTNTTPAEETPA